MVMAVIYTNCRQYDNAIDELDALLSLGSVYTINDLKWNLMLTPLRKLPRYQEMMRKYGAPSDSL